MNNFSNSLPRLASSHWQECAKVLTGREVRVYWAIPQVVGALGEAYRISPEVSRINIHPDLLENNPETALRLFWIYLHEVAHCKLHHDTNDIKDDAAYSPGRSDFPVVLPNYWKAHDTFPKEIEANDLARTWFTQSQDTTITDRLIFFISGGHN